MPQLPFAPSARSGHSMVALPDGRVMLYGGQSQTGQQYNDMYTYNANGWTQIHAGNVPPALTGHSTWIVGQRMYVSGGNGPQGATNDTWYYDLQSNAWHEVNISGPVPSPRFGHSSTQMPDGSILIFGGTDAGGTVLRDFWRLNPDNSYTRMPDAPFPYTHHIAQLTTDGEMLLIFGAPYRIMFFDFVSYMWDFIGTDLPMGGHAAGITTQNTAGENVLFLFGGNDAGGNESAGVYEVNLSTLEWSQRTDSMPFPLTDSAVAAMQTQPLQTVFFGGISNGIAIGTTITATIGEAPPPPPVEIDEFVYDNSGSPVTTETAYHYSSINILKEESLVSEVGDPGNTGCEHCTGPCEKCGKSCGTESGVSTGIYPQGGDPVFLNNLEFTWSITLLEIPGRGMPYEYKAHYHSRKNFHGILGHGWEGSLNMRLLPHPTEANQVIFYDGTGRGDTYVVLSDGTYLSPESHFKKIVRAGDGLLLRQANGTVIKFFPLDDAVKAGRLAAIINRCGGRLTMEYNSLGQMVTVLDTLSGVFGSWGRPLISPD